MSWVLRSVAVIAFCSSATAFAGPPATILVTATPNVVPKNSTSTINALVKDSGNAPVSGVQVNFYFVKDHVQSNLSSPVATTNAQGNASVTYSSSSIPSEKDGVVLGATVSSTSISGQVSLTVAGQGQRIDLTPGAVTRSGCCTNQYAFAVKATDAVGGALANATVYFTLQSPGYFKGQYAKVDSNGVALGDPGYNGTPVKWAPKYYVACRNEDLDKDGFNDMGEDVNHNGQLDGSGGASVPSSITLDANGSGQVLVTYLASYASWIQARVSAQTTDSSGFWQDTAYVDFVPPILPSDATNLSTPPPAGSFGATAGPYGDARGSDNVPGSDPVCPNPN